MKIYRLYVAMRWYMLPSCLILLANFLSICLPRQVISFDRLYPQSAYESLLNDTMCLLSEVKKSVSVDFPDTKIVRHVFVRLKNLSKKLHSFVAENDYTADDIQYLIKLFNLIVRTIVIARTYSRAMTPESVPAINMPKAPI